MGNTKANKGITLISLVITIIILLILAAVSINVIFGQDGMIQKTKDAKTKTEIAQEKEILQFSLADIMLENNGKLVFDEETLKNAIERNSNIEGIEVEKITDDMYMVTFTTSGRYYEVNSDGNVKTTVAKVNDETPGQWEGDGTKENPYLIKSIEDLVALSDSVSPRTQDAGTEKTYNSYANKWFKLENDLDFSSVNSYVDPDRTDFGDANDDGTSNTLLKEMTEGSGFRPIGTYDNPFSGNIDGNGHTISNLYMNNSKSYQAFIGYASYSNIDGIVQNLNFKNIKNENNIDSAYNGVIFGYVKLEQTTVKVSNCTLSGKIETNPKNAGYSAGVASYIYGVNGSDTNIEIESVTNNTSILTSKDRSSGIIGYSYDVKNMKFNNVLNTGNIQNGSGLLASSEMMQNIEVNNCANKGDIKGRAGLIAFAQGKSAITSIVKINNSYNTGKITSTDTYTGGIAGRLDVTELYVTNSYNTGKITSTSSYTGGIVGRTYIKTHITNCYNGGEITATSVVGGIVGEYTRSGVSSYDLPELKIEKCYNTEKITGDDRNIAGIVARVNSEGTSDVIKYCYNTGDIESISGSQTAGIVADAVFKLKILNCYNKGNIKSKGYVSGIVAYDSSSSSGCEISNTYNTGIVTGEYNIGSILGYGMVTSINNSYNIGEIKLAEGASDTNYKGSISGGNITAQNCYYLKDTCNVAVGGGPYSSQDGTTLVETLEQMKQLLNTNLANLQGWKQGQDGYPTIDM